MIYDRPTKTLMLDYAGERLKPGQVFDRSDAVHWFGQHYAKINPKTVEMHVEAMAVNNPVRKHHSNVRPGTGYDLFIKVGPQKFRLWDSEHDPAPRYGSEFTNSTISDGSSPTNAVVQDPEEADVETPQGAAEFAFEKDLRNYLVKNLNTLEEGLTLYQDEEFTGVEYPVGGRYIDVLAVDQTGDFVVIELKVSRGYDRTIGQILRYMGWIRKNLAADKAVRGIIVASDITEDLMLAASQIADIRLVEYEISFRLRSR